MNLSKHIVKNIFALTSSSIILTTALFVFNILVARYLGDVEFGKYSFAIAFTSLFLTLSHLGLEVVVTRDIALDKSRVQVYFGNVLILLVILSLSTFLLILLTAYLMQFTNEKILIVTITAVAIMAMSFMSLCRSIFRAFEKMEWDMIPSICGACFLLIFGISALIAGYNIFIIAVIYTLTYILIFVVALIIVAKKFAKVNINIKLPLWKYLLSSTIPFTLNGLLLNLFDKIDIVLLAFMQNDSVVAWYSAAKVLSIVPLLLVGSGIARALFPFVARAYVLNKEHYMLIINRTIKYSSLILIPIGIGMTFISEKMISIIFGSQFVSAAPALQFLIWSGILLFLNYIYINVMEATGKQKSVTVLIGSGVVIITILNFLLIPSFSLLGSSIAELVTQIICLIAFCFLVGGKNELIKLGCSVIKPLIAIIPMSIFLYYLENIQIILLICGAAVIYFLFLFIIGGISKEDKQLIKDFIKKSY